MSNQADFLIEIGTEELPPKDLANLATNFATLLQEYLIENSISFAQDQVKSFASPRRLAVLIPNLVSQQPEQVISKRGPALSAAYNADGTPTKAALGFAQVCNTELAQLRIQETDKGKWLFFSSTVAGKETIELLPKIIEKALLQLHVKKRMRWCNGDFAFVRPIHWLLMLFGKDVVPAEIFGIKADNYTYGHRIHHPQAIVIASPDKYVEKLEHAKVIPCFTKRKLKIAEQVAKISAEQQASADLDPELLDLITGLVEYPVALTATFANDFLRVPKECLISAIKKHQKCIPLLSAENKLLAMFILISNLESTDPQTVINGNELVMHARLADAAFYYDSDLQTNLAAHVPALQNVVYQKQLGSVYDKIMRIEKLAAFMAKKLNCDVDSTKRAAYLCKADLLTNMVYEFPELQGVMGKYYALYNNESAIVAQAIEEHYQPRFANDNSPTIPEASCIAIADRVDTLVGMFSIGNIPTGEKDPYALRRQALAVIRMLTELKVNFDLKELFSLAVNNYAPAIKDPSNELIPFCLERLKSFYAEAATPQVFAAILATNTTSPLDFHQRLLAINEFLASPAALNLAAANKRVANILNKETDLTDNLFVDVAKLETKEEQVLYATIQNKEAEISPLLNNANYAAALHSLSTLQAPVDSFFNNVMVMVEDSDLRNNRLALLQRLRSLFMRVADVSLL